MCIITFKIVTRLPIFRDAIPIDSSSSAMASELTYDDATAIKRSDRTDAGCVWLDGWMAWCGDNGKWSQQPPRIDRGM